MTLKKKIYIYKLVNMICELEVSITRSNLSAYETKVASKWEQENLFFLADHRSWTFSSQRRIFCLLHYLDAARERNHWWQQSSDYHLPLKMWKSIVDNEIAILYKLVQR